MSTCNHGNEGTPSPEGEQVIDRPKPTLLVHPATKAGWRDFCIGMGVKIDDSGETQPTDEELTPGKYNITLAPEVHRHHFLTMDGMISNTNEICQTLADKYGCCVLGNNVMCRVLNTTRQSGVINPSSFFPPTNESDPVKLTKEFAEHFKCTGDYLYSTAKACKKMLIDVECMSYSVIVKPYLGVEMTNRQITVLKYQAAPFEGGRDDDMFDCLHHMSVESDNRLIQLRYVGTPDMMRELNLRAKSMCELIEAYHADTEN